MSSLASSTVPPVPTSEHGVVLPTLPTWAMLGGAGVYVDTIEQTPALRWPTSVRDTYPAMRNDTQLTALLRGTVLSLRRFVWGIDRNGSSPAVFERVCSDYNILPIDDALEQRATGRSPRPVGRGQNRFSFAEHMRLALDALWMGHVYFEQVYPIGADGLAHVGKLAYRPQDTIVEFLVEPDGGLSGIEQQVGLKITPLSIDRLVAYVWDQMPGNWTGRSMFRSCYREWLIKDRLIRIDASNHEKGGGVWWAEAAPNMTAAERQELAGMAVAAQAGGGGSVPAGAKLHLERPSATGGATVVDSINRHDEAMARAWLMMVIQLGSTQTGSRALGSEFAALKDDSDEAIATWLCSVFNEHVIEDDVDWNEGRAEDFTPRLIYMRPEAATPPAAVASAVADATVDPATQAALNGAPAAEVAALRAQVQRRDREYRARLEQRLPELFSSDDPAEAARLAGQLADLVNFDGVDEAITEELDAALSSRSRRGRGSPGGAGRAQARLSLPDRPLRRQPYDHEVRAAVDFAALDRAWQTELEQLISAWGAVRTTQVDQLRAQIEQAAGDLERLAAVKAATIGADVVAPVLERAAAQAAAEAVAEAKRQGKLEATLPNLDREAKELGARAGATAELLTRSLSETAGRRAVQLSGGAITASAVADEVATHLDALSDTYLRDQLGGAIVAAQNTGRSAAMADLQPSRIYASELLDVNCCSPCIAEDGREFGSLEEAATAYPTGGFKDCLGGPRCRGTIVAVYDEAPASA